MQDTATRRQAILDALSTRRFETMPSLANEFGVSVRTIVRDIEFLSNSAPIYTVSGHGGGVRYLEGQYNTHRYLSNDQIVFLENLKEQLPANGCSMIQSIIDQFSLPHT